MNYDIIMRELKERRDRLLGSLESGECQSYDEYRYVTGQLRGLNEAMRVLEEEYDRSIESDD